MKLSLPLLSLLAAHGASALQRWPLDHRPPGMMKGTFNNQVASNVASASNGRTKGNCGPNGGGGGKPGGGGGGRGGGGGEGSSTPAPTFGWGTFNQIIDHNNTHLGTFSQRFWYSTEYWAGPGSPIILANPGEQSGTGWNVTYLTNQRITGYFAENVQGAVVILEHRYWGESSPYPDLTVPHLKYLTVDQALRDMTYFANSWIPPFDTSGKSKPSEAPWVLCGGSYPGALASWAANLAASEPEATRITSPFWAYYATSGVVEAIGDFWQYYNMVQQATPTNCSTDLVNVIAYIDNILLHGTSQQKADLKAPFLLSDLVDADFAKALSFGPIVYQQTQFFLQSLYGYSPYYMFCDYIENMWPGSGQTLPGASGVGVTKALAGYAKWFSTVVLPDLCQELGYTDFQGIYNTGCLQNLNATNAMYRDLSPDNAVSRQWWWLLCNEPLAWFQDTAPSGQPSIVSKLVNYDYNIEICKTQFPDAVGSFGLNHGASTDQVNSRTGGWSVPTSRTPRLLYTNGERDPWRAATVSSDWRPGGPLANSNNVPVHIVPGGGHCSDVYAENWAVNPGVKAVADAETATIVQWVNDFYHEKGITKPH
ncbi:hypothetical protein SBRCBS47491_001415 [Sporothrix bragantina]|uniref:Serine peptidase n=1 Tax=Sporothrix bragantina TaxID=671064 RepID=A0ABP0AYL9_9PEZI